MIGRVRPTYVPFAGMPLTVTMSAISVTTKKFLGVAAGVVAETVANSAGSDMSA